MERKNQNTFTPSLLGSCLGVIVSFALIAIVIVLSVTFGSTGKTSYYKKNSVLHLTLEGVVPEKSGNQTDDGFVFGSQEEAIGLQRIVELIRHAATDDKIKGIYLENNNISMGQSSLYTIIQELNEFKKSGKFAVVPKRYVKFDHDSFLFSRRHNDIKPGFGSDQRQTAAIRG